MDPAAEVPVADTGLKAESSPQEGAYGLRAGYTIMLATSLLCNDRTRPTWELVGSGRSAN